VPAGLPARPDNHRPAATDAIRQPAPPAAGDETSNVRDRDWRRDQARLSPRSFCTLTLTGNDPSSAQKIEPRLRSRDRTTASDARHGHCWPAPTGLRRRGPVRQPAAAGTLSGNPYSSSDQVREGGDQVRKQLENRRCGRPNRRRSLTLGGMPGFRSDGLHPDLFVRS
jgi:hypothetical protein